MVRQKGGFLYISKMIDSVMDEIDKSDKNSHYYKKGGRKRTILTKGAYLRKRAKREGGLIKQKGGNYARNKRAKERHEAKKYWQRYWGNRERKMANRYEQSIKGFRTTNDSLRRELAFYKKNILPLKKTRYIAKA